MQQFFLGICTAIWWVTEPNCKAFYEYSYRLDILCDFSTLCWLLKVMTLDHKMKVKWKLEKFVKTVLAWAFTSFPQAPNLS